MTEQYQTVYSCQGKCGTSRVEVDVDLLGELETQGARFDIKYGVYRRPSTNISFKEEAEFDMLRHLMSSNGKPHFRFSS